MMVSDCSKKEGTHDEHRLKMGEKESRERCYLQSYDSRGLAGGPLFVKSEV